MAITKVVPSMFAVANGEIVSGVTVGNTTSIAALTFDESGVIVAASNVTVTVANTNITGTITNDQIAGVANTKINGLITSDQIANVASDKIIGTLGGNYIQRVYNSPATWTKPDGLKAIKVTVVGAGGNGGAGSNAPVYSQIIWGGHGGGGGASIEYLTAPAIPGPVSVTVGTAPAKTSSFGAFLSATGGSNGGNSNASPGAGGAGIGGDLNFTGVIGDSGQISPAGGSSPFNTIAPSKLGGGPSALGFATYSSALPASNGVAYGGGAAGRAGSGSGGIGADGVVIVEEFY